MKFEIGDEVQWKSNGKEVLAEMEKSGKRMVRVPHDGIPYVFEIRARGK